jgi:hypothetical protein
LVPLLACTPCFCRQLLFALLSLLQMLPPRPMLQTPLLMKPLPPLRLPLPLLFLLLRFQGLALKPKQCLSSSIACCRRLCQTKRRPRLAGKQSHQGLSPVGRCGSCR